MVISQDVIAGYSSTGVEGSCAPCAVGQFKNISGNGPCFNCEVDSVSVLGASAASECKCKEGYSATIGEGSCAPCAEGKFKSTVGSEACEDCAEDETSPAGSASALSCLRRCQPGTSGPNGGPCISCLPGSFKPVFGNEGCTECPEHSQSAPGSELVSQCQCNQGYSRGNQSGAMCVPLQSGHTYPVTLVLEVFTSIEDLTFERQVRLTGALAAAAGVRSSDVSILSISSSAKPKTLRKRRPLRRSQDWVKESVRAEGDQHVAYLLQLSRSQVRLSILVFDAAAAARLKSRLTSELITSALVSAGLPIAKLISIDFASSASTSSTSKLVVSVDSADKDGAASTSRCADGVCFFVAVGLGVAAICLLVACLVAARCVWARRRMQAAGTGMSRSSVDAGSRLSNSGRQTHLEGPRDENALSTEPAYLCAAKASKDGQRTEVKEQEQEQEEICEICCVAYQEGDELKMLPCGHCFHKRCADKWLQSTRVCQQCKVEVEISL